MSAIKWSFILLIVTATAGLLAFGPRATSRFQRIGW